MPLIASAKIIDKLAKKHGVTMREVAQCFENRTGGLLQDKRERHRTTPPTLWFIANTNANRPLKIMFVQEDENIYLKSAFNPDEEEKRIYAKYG